MFSWEEHPCCRDGADIHRLSEWVVLGKRKMTYLGCAKLTALPVGLDLFMNRSVLGESQKISGEVPGKSGDSPGEVHGASALSFQTPGNRGRGHAFRLGESLVRHFLGAS